MTIGGSQTSQRMLAGHEEHWISVSDLMAVLMMIFLLIAIVYQAIVEIDKEKIEEVAIVYDRLRGELYEDLLHEFENDLPRWGAAIDKDLVIRFQEPEILFDAGSDAIKPDFAAILSDFFPRYIRLLTSDKYVKDIQEVRIEGHTSSECRQCADEAHSYIYNMELSQARTRSTLEFVLGLPGLRQHQRWLRSHVTANGLSFSKLITDASGLEDRAKSRRVEFRVRTNAEERIAKILEIAGE